MLALFPGPVALWGHCLEKHMPVTLFNDEETPQKLCNCSLFTEHDKSGHKSYVQ